MLATLVAQVGTLGILVAGQLQHAAGEAVGPVLSARDSAAALRHARNAQAAFELFRRFHLARGERMSGPCDVVVGRYCYWRGDDDDSDDEKPPEEPAAIRRRRDDLLALLDSLAGLMPGDAWIAGQRVRYLVDAGRPEEAAKEAGTRCRATVSWCDALAGYAWHRAGKYGAADSSFARALAAMPSNERCKWLDIGPLLDGELHSRFDHSDCDHRDSLATRLLRLGAPLYSLGGADLLTEQLSRVTRSRISDRTYLVEGPSWGDDSRELVLRYGWPTWYTRADPPVGTMFEASIIGHDAGRPFYFLPTARVLDHPGTSADDDWQLNDRRAPTGYAPAYARSIHVLPAQIARFRHGDTAIVVAAWNARGDTTLAGRALRAGLVLTTDGTDGTRAIMDSATDRGALVARALVDSGIVSLELIAREQRRAARTRIGLPAAVRATLAISDLLLYGSEDGSAGDPAMEPIEQLAQAALATPRLVGRRLGIYWEVYGARASAPLEYSVSVRPSSTAWFRRAAERLGIGEHQSTLYVRWSDLARSESASTRAMQVDLSRLRAGSYDLTVTASSGGAVAHSVRRIELP